jgi:hypothetical protein
MKVPVALGSLLVVLWLGAGRLTTLRRPLAVVAGACLAWAATVHAGDDLVASRRRRAFHLAWQDAYARSLPPGPVAVLTYWGAKDAFGGLLVPRDIVILDVWADDVRDAPGLVDDLLRQGRRVFVATDRMPVPVFRRIVEGRVVKPVLPEDVLLEIEPGPASPP